jgi:hypothetical protein
MSETTSWDLAEFRKHSGRLGEVAAKVEAAAGKAKEAQDSNGQAFGILFGSIVAPLLNLVCGDTEEYARKLAEAVSNSAENIDRTAKSYEQSEQDRADSLVEVDWMLG